MAESVNEGDWSDTTASVDNQLGQELSRRGEIIQAQAAQQRWLDSDSMVAAVGLKKYSNIG